MIKNLALPYKLNNDVDIRIRAVECLYFGALVNYYKDIYKLIDATNPLCMPIFMIKYFVHEVECRIITNGTNYENVMSAWTIDTTGDFYKEYRVRPKEWTLPVIPYKERINHVITDFLESK